MRALTESSTLRNAKKLGSRPDAGSINEDKFPKNTQKFVFFCLVFIVLFPKAGVRSGEIPLYLSTFLFFTLTAILVLSRKQKNYEILLVVNIVYLAGWLGITYVRNDIFLLSNASRTAAISWFLVSPIFWMAASNYRSILLSPKIIDIFFIILTIYALCQYFFGLDFLRINGLTIAYGDSYATKNLAIFQNTTVVGLKAPSTYQSGNLFGQIAALFFVWGISTQRFKTYKSKASKILIPLTYLVAITISLSRTALLAVLLGIFVHVVSSKGKSILRYLFVIIIFMYFVSSISLLGQRFSLDNLFDSSGRTESWSIALSSFTVGDWFFGRSSTGLGSTKLLYLEGLFGMIAQIGIVGLCLLFFAWTKSGLLKWKAFSATFGFCLMIDSTFINPTFMWIPGVCILLSGGAQGTRHILDKTRKKIPNATKTTV